MNKDKTVALILAAGSGKRMQADVPKQFLEIQGKPIIYHTLKAFDIDLVDEIVLVTREEDVEYCMNDIVKKYHFTKVTSVVAGGKERYHSVYRGLCAISDCTYVMIHDGARPFADAKILERNLDEVKQYRACVTGMPVKDTIKEAKDDGSGFVARTPRRDLLWTIQTPQTFSYELILDAYRSLLADEAAGKKIAVTDDAMVAERYTQIPVKLVEGSYANVKITTPDDMLLAEAYMQNSPVQLCCGDGR